MARITDPQKLENIKRATMEMMVDTGYRGLTVSKIAKNAGVSVGYLYRHYDGKMDLINELIEQYFDYFRTQLFGSVKTAKTIREIVQLFVEKVVNIALDDPIPIMFLASLAHDLQFHSEKTSEVMENGIGLFLTMVLERGLETGEISRDTLLLEMHLMLIQYPLDFVTLKLCKEFKSQPLSEADVNRITDLVCNALR